MPRGDGGWQQVKIPRSRSSPTLRLVNVRESGGRRSLGEKWQGTLVGRSPTQHRQRRSEHIAPLAAVCVGYRDLRSGVALRALLGSVKGPDRADLDPTAGCWYLLGHGDGLVEVGGLDHVVAAEGLLGLGERAVGDREAARGVRAQ